MPEFILDYTCPACGANWSQMYSCQVDDTCQRCGARNISPKRVFEWPPFHETEYEEQDEDDDDESEPTSELSNDPSLEKN